MSPPHRGRGKVKPLLPTPPPTHMGAHPMSPLGNLPLSSPHSHGSSSHVSPWVMGEGTCTCQYNERVHTVPPTYKGERLDVAPPPIGGGMGIHPMPPVRGGHGSLSHVPPEEGGAYFCPSLPHLSPLTWELIPCSPPGLPPTLHPPLTWELIPCPSP